MRRVAVVVLACLLPVALLAPSAAAEGLSIDHRGVGCVVADKFPRFEARFDPAEKVARARLHFKPEGGLHWYSVAMKPEGGAFAGVLPKPKKKLRSFSYYIEVTDTGLATSRTEEYTPGVASGPAACKDKAIAGTLASATVAIVAPAGAPLVPAGFSSAGVVAASAAGPTGAAVGTVAAAGGGHAAAIVLGVVGAGAVAGGVVAATHKSTPAAPPSVTGIWTGTEVDTGTGVLPADNCSAETLSLTLTLTQSGSSLSGTRDEVVVSPGLCADGSSNPVGSTNRDRAISGTVSPPTITFSGPCAANTGGVFTWVGTISGNSMSGTDVCSYAAGAETQGRFTGTWNVTRR